MKAKILKTQGKNEKLSEALNTAHDMYARCFLACIGLVDEYRSYFSFHFGLLWDLVVFSGEILPIVLLE